MPTAHLTLATTYFNQFVEAFAQFDGERVASLFVAPVVALQSDGVLIGLPSREEVARYYQAALEAYHAEGCRVAKWSDLATTGMGDQSLLAAVSWELLREDGSVVTHWRQSYGLSLFYDGTPKAFFAISHA